MELLDRGVPEVWRRSIAEALAVIDLLDAPITPIEQELGPLASADARVALPDTIPGMGALLGLTIASEIGDVARFGSPRKLIGHAGLAPRINQSRDRSRTGALSRAGSPTLRWAAVEAAHHAGGHQSVAPALQRHGTRRQEPRQVRGRAQDPHRRPARPLAPATLQARRATAAQPCLGKLPLPSGRPTAPHGIEKPRQLPRTLTNREHPAPPTTAPQPTPALLDTPTAIKEKAALSASLLRFHRCRSEAGPIARRRTPAARRASVRGARDALARRGSERRSHHRGASATGPAEAAAPRRIARAERLRPEGLGGDPDAL
jgi:Transposase IS116/IS110/IS902 family